MANIEGFRLKNYGTLRDILLGKLWNLSGQLPLTPMTAVIGKNGTGKSTIFDAFGFLSDCLKFGVEEACDARGGFRNIRSKGQDGSIRFDISYKQTKQAVPITYRLSIDLGDDNRPFVEYEALIQSRENSKEEWSSVCFLLLEQGKGIAWQGEEGELIEQSHLDLPKLTIEEEVRGIRKGFEFVELNDKRKLGIATLGSLKQHPRISLFRQFIEGWYLSYFTPDAARSLPLAGPQRHLNSRGDNLGNVVQFMEREHSDKFAEILQNIASKIPGIDKISTERSPDNRLLLKFNDRGFQDPFYAQQMSDGTLKVFAYLLLLEDPSPPPFICIEEPENGLYHKLLETLVDEFRTHATGGDGRSQIFVTTHQPYFVDALQPEEVWVLEKQEDGFSTVKRASEDPLIQNLVSQGIPLGGLWYSDYLDAR